MFSLDGEIIPQYTEERKSGWGDLMGVGTKPLLVTFEKLCRMG